MSRYDKPPSANDVDWNHPDIQSLLSKTEGWNLDNRGVHPRMACELHVGWGAGVGRGATLVYQREGVMVVETRFAIPNGEQVRVDRIQAGALRSSWGTVVDGREGFRAEDRAQGVHVHWLRVR